jgi:predicted RNase H-like HicB family nuclease
MDRRGSRTAWCTCLGQTLEEAVARVNALALRVLADRLDHGEGIPELDSFFSAAP